MAEAVGALPRASGPRRLCMAWEDDDEMFSVLVRDRRIRPLKPSGVGIVPTSVHSGTVNAQSNSHEEREPTH